MEITVGIEVLQHAEYECARLQPGRWVGVWRQCVQRGNFVVVCFDDMRTGRWTGEKIGKELAFDEIFLLVGCDEGIMNDCGGAVSVQGHVEDRE